MKWALDHLGLDKTADESAVKRAYAKLLKVTRPDDDPAGFQKLREAYQAALSWLKHRDEWDDEEPTEDEAGSPAEPEEKSPAPTEVDLQPAERPSPVMASPDVGYVDAGSAQDFRFDPEAFIEDLFEKAAHEDSFGLSRWILAQSIDWPLWVKPRTAHAVVAHLFRERPPMPAQQLQVIVQFFNLDDVLVMPNGMDLEDLSVELEQKHDRHLRSSNIQQLMLETNRDRLMALMRNGPGRRYPDVVTRWVIWLLTAVGAHNKAPILRRIPFVTQTVMGFLNRLDGGRLDALAPAIPQETSGFWYYADEKRKENRPILLGLVVVFTLIIGPMVFSGWQRGGLSGPQYSNLRTNPELVTQRRTEEAARSVVNLIRQQIAAGHTSDVAHNIKALVREYGESRYRLVHHDVSDILLAAGLFLKKQERIDDAVTVFRDLETRYSWHDSEQIQARVGAATIENAAIAYNMNRHDDALNAYERLILLYRNNRDSRVEIQVARALYGKAHILNARNNIQASGAAAKDLIDLCGYSDDPRMKSLVELAKDIDPARQRSPLAASHMPPTSTP
jgi:tetratricopeptide (TPR) repeat protein